MVEGMSEQAVLKKLEDENRRHGISSGVRALASAPHLVPFGVYFVLALSTGKETEIESEGARPTHPRARAVALHIYSVGPRPFAPVQPPHNRA